jgi:hypothetical protein
MPARSGGIGVASKATPNRPIWSRRRERAPRYSAEKRRGRRDGSAHRAGRLATHMRCREHLKRNALRKLGNLRLQGQGGRGMDRQQVRDLVDEVASSTSAGRRALLHCPGRGPVPTQFHSPSSRPPCSPHHPSPASISIAASRQRASPDRMVRHETSKVARRVSCGRPQPWGVGRFVGT